MARLLAIAALVLVGVALVSGSADAAPHRTVRIETDPPGATVYVGDKESGSRGVTPMELVLPLGDATVILEREGYTARTETVTVEKGKRKQVVAFTLDASVSAIKVTGPDGARLVVDGEDHGTVPRTLEVTPGPHEVQVVVEGKPPFDQWVDVPPGGTARVDAKVGVPSAAELAAEAKAKARAAATPIVIPPRPWGELGVGYEIGWRSFRYDNATKGDLQPYDGNGLGLIAIAAELHPWRAMRKAHRLWPASLTVGFGYGLPSRAVSTSGPSADIFWRTADVGVRWRWNVSRPVALDFDAGWARLLYAFRDDNGAIVDAVPDVDYEMVRLGVRGVVHTGPIRGWLGLENRVVVSGGLVEDRFRQASASGVVARLGGDYQLAHGLLAVRAEAVYTHLGWTFHPIAQDANIADGASDGFTALNFAIVGAY